jgi:hypothetical protein
LPTVAGTAILHRRETPAGDIRAAGVYRSPMLRRVPVTRYGRRLVEPGFGLADIAFDALGHGPRNLSVV